MKWYSHTVAKPKKVKKPKKILTPAQADIKRRKADPRYKTALAKMKSEKADEATAKASVAAGLSKASPAVKAQLMTFLQEHGVHAP